MNASLRNDEYQILPSTLSVLLFNKKGPEYHSEPFQILLNQISIK